MIPFARDPARGGLDGPAMRRPATLQARYRDLAPMSHPADTRPSIPQTPRLAPAPAPAPTPPRPPAVAPAPVAAAAPVAPVAAAPAPAAPKPVAPPTTPGAQVRTLTGAETPYSVTPGASAASPLLGQLTQVVGQQLANPAPFDSDLFQQSLDAGRRALNEDLGGRGMLFSTTGSDLLGSRVLLPLLQQREATLANARTQAINNAAGVAGMVTGNERANRDELRGERGYTDTLRNTAHDQALQEYLAQQQVQQAQDAAYRQLLGLGAGYGTGGSLLGSSALLGQAANQYGANAAGTTDLLGQLAQLYMLRGGSGGTN